MSIISEITRIKANIASAYLVLVEKGATLPELQNSQYLASCIDTVSTKSVTEGGVAVNTFNGYTKSAINNVGTVVKVERFLS